MVWSKLSSTLAVGFVFASLFLILRSHWDIIVFIVLLCFFLSLFLDGSLICMRFVGFSSPLEVLRLVSWCSYAAVNMSLTHSSSQSEKSAPETNSILSREIVLLHYFSFISDKLNYIFWKNIFVMFCENYLVIVLIVCRSIPVFFFCCSWPSVLKKTTCNFGVCFLPRVCFLPKLFFLLLERFWFSSSHIFYGCIYLGSFSVLRFHTYLKLFLDQFC